MTQDQETATIGGAGYLEARTVVGGAMYPRLRR